jgi:hypothetical protein
MAAAAMMPLLLAQAFMPSNLPRVMKTFDIALLSLT